MFAVLAEAAVKREAEEANSGGGGEAGDRRRGQGAEEAAGKGQKG